MRALRVHPAWASRRLSTDMADVSTTRKLRALHALDDVGDGQALRLPDQRWRQLAPSFVGYLRLVQVAQLQSRAPAGGDVIAQRPVEAEDGLEVSPLHVPSAPDEVPIVLPCRAVFSSR